MIRFILVSVCLFVAGCSSSNGPSASQAAPVTDGLRVALQDAFDNGDIWACKTQLASSPQVSYNRIEYLIRIDPTEQKYERYDPPPHDSSRFNHEHTEFILHSFGGHRRYGIREINIFQPIELSPSKLEVNSQMVWYEKWRTITMEGVKARTIFNCSIAHEPIIKGADIPQWPGHWQEGMDWVEPSLMLDYVVSAGKSFACKSRINSDVVLANSDTVFKLRVDNFENYYHLSNSESSRGGVFISTPDRQSITGPMENFWLLDDVPYHYEWRYNQLLLRTGQDTARKADYVCDIEL